MTDERTFPILPARDLDESLAFYEALGFTCTYRQTRPNPYAVVAREDLQLHLCGIDGFDPAQSYGSAIAVVPDPDGLYRAFANGLRSAYGRLPVAGIPRLLRPRKKQGTVRGFSVVDPGGNWLRISKLGETEEAEAAHGRSTGLARVIDNAARLGDAKGDDGQALRLLDNGLDRFPDAPLEDRVRAQLYRAELALRVGDRTAAAQAVAEAETMTPGLEPAIAASLREELDDLLELVRGEP